MKPPSFLFIETTTECNLRCRQCHMWLSTEPGDALNTREKVALIDELAAWSPGATVVLTGGETMRKREEFFALTAACRRHGLAAATNTNATYIDGDDVVDRLLVEGPRYLVISLDSHRPELHDWVRGQPGTGEHVITTIGRLIERRRAAFPDSDLKIMTNMILFDGNVDEIGSSVEFLANLGVDGVMFQALSRTFWHRGDRDVFFEAHFPKDTERFDAAIDGLVAMQAAGAPIITTANDLGWMKLYARDPDFIGEQVCGSHERNMMVDQRGDVQLCFSMRGLMGGNALGNVRSTPLRALWEAEMAGDARSVMSSCRQNCGMLNCHRRIES